MATCFGFLKCHQKAIQNGYYCIIPQENNSVLYAIFFQYFTMPDKGCSKNAETWCNIIFSKISKTVCGPTISQTMNGRELLSWALITFKVTISITVSLFTSQPDQKPTLSLGVMP
jgi:hypothetical protein